MGVVDRTGTLKEVLVVEADVWAETGVTKALVNVHVTVLTGPAPRTQTLVVGVKTVGAMCVLAWVASICCYVNNIYLYETQSHNLHMHVYAVICLYCYIVYLLNLK